MQDLAGDEARSFEIQDRPDDVGDLAHTPDRFRPPALLRIFLSRAKEAHRVLPHFCNGQAILKLAVAPAELDGRRTIRTFFPS